MENVYFLQQESGTRGHPIESPHGGSVIPGFRHDWSGRHCVRQFVCDDSQNYPIGETMPVFQILSAFVFVALALTGFQLFGFVMYDCRVGDKGVDLMLFRYLRVWRIPYEDIDAVSPVTVRELVLKFGGVFFTYAGRPFGPFVMLKRKKGIVRAVVITPRDRDRFVEIVNSNLCIDR